MARTLFSIACHGEQNVRICNKIERDEFMRIDHTAVYVRDLEKTRAFYEKYFGAVSNAQYFNPKTGLRTYFLTFAQGGRLEIMSKPDLHEIGIGGEHYGYMHLAFSVGDNESVDRLTGLLRSDDYTVYSGPRTTGDGYYESCVSDPDGNRIEIVA